MRTRTPARMNALCTRGLAPLLVLAAVTLTACAEQPPRAETDSRPTASASPTAPVTAAPPSVFGEPTRCSEALPASRIVVFEEDRNLVLLGGPDGRYGLEYALDPSPEERAGGITCIWGFSVSEISSVTVSVAPITASSRSAIIADLIGQGLNEAVNGDAEIFWQEGDTDQQPAMVNVIRSDSWISVIQTIGGPDAYDDALAIAAEAHDTVYR